MMKHRLLALASAALFAGTAPSAFAQAESLLVQPSLPDEFDKGRNVSVMQRARPDYDAIGIRSGSFTFFPEVTAALGYSNNIYYSAEDKVGAAYVLVVPAIRVESDWSRHKVKLQGNVQAQRFFSEPRRNQTPWNLAGLTSLDVGSSLRFTPEVQISRQYENAFSGETSSDRSVLSSYFRAYGGLRTEYTGGQTKLTLAIDDTDYEFKDVRLRSGALIDQSDRDRNLFRVTGQAQYALTPSAAVYVQAGYIKTNYDRLLLNGNPNRDANGYRIIGGMNFDLAGLMRGTVGVGFTRRDFRSGLYRDVKGISFEGKLEYFPSELTTLTVAVRRIIEDSSFGTNAAFFDNRGLVQVDHELLRNLILSGFAEATRQSYIDSPLRADVYRIGASGNFLSSNWLSFNARLAYTGRTTNQPNLGRGFNEFLGQVGVTIKR